MKKLTRKNPTDIYSLWKELNSKDSSKARKAALALKPQLAGKTSLSDFWPIIREERDLTVSEIKAKVESVIKKTSGARANPVRKVVKKRNPGFNKDLERLVNNIAVISRPDQRKKVGILEQSDGSYMSPVSEYDLLSEDGKEILDFFKVSDVIKIDEMIIYLK
jgi:hypothetical protein